MGRTSDAKEKLLNVATELIWEQSYGAVSVDQICDKADVNKGSFYHFFASKSELAIAAFEEHWEKNQPVYDQIFSVQVSPLDRLKRYCEAAYSKQKEIKRKSGQVLGCPYASVGSELCTQDDGVRKTATEMFNRTCKYIEATLRDAFNQGLIPEQDFSERAEAIFSFVIGKLLQARIKNDAEILKELYPSVLQLIGAPSRI